MRTLALIALFAACGSEPPEQEPAAPPAVPAPGVLPEPRLPRAPGEHAPSFAQIPAAVSGAAIADTDICGSCHPDVLAQWQTSAHAFASLNNPIYRVSVEGFLNAQGAQATSFCAGCHDVALLADGVPLAEASPDDPRATVGISCRVCHGIESVTADGNGSYALSATAIALPRDGDHASVAEHKRTAALAPLRTAALCGSCHRAFLGEATGNGSHLPGMDDFTSWRRSPYAGSRLDRIDGPIAERDCRGCHMPRESSSDPAAKDGTVASHRFVGGHSWLAAMRGDAAALERAQSLLKTAATIDVAAVSVGGERHLPADGAPVRGGELLLIDVVVRNTGVGHRFPGGTLDAQDTWIELTVRDAGGRLLGRAGADHETAPDPTAHILRALVVDEHGQPALVRDVHRFRAVAWDHTVAPRDARAARYELRLPPSPAFPLAITARLRHRSRGLALQNTTCDVGRSGDHARAALDPCAPQPITDIAASQVFVGPGSEPAPESARTWQRTYDHGLASMHSLQEHLDDARASLDRALGAAGRRSAMTTLLLGRLAAKQGRLDEANQWLDRTERLEPNPPAIAMARAEAHAQMWRWGDAARFAGLATGGAAGDDRAWSTLAVASASAGDPAAALAAAVRGLDLSPRDPDLLRTQALALDKLGQPTAAAAMDAFLAHRRRDDAPVLRAMCSKNVEGCARDRTPLHVHQVPPSWSP